MSDSERRYQFKDTCGSVSPQFDENDPLLYCKEKRTVSNDAASRISLSVGDDVSQHVDLTSGNSQMCSNPSTSVQALNDYSVQSLRSQQLDEAENCLLKAYYLEPGSPATAFHLGLLYEQRGKDHFARVSYKRCADQSPHFAPAWYKLGHAQRVTGDYSAAEQSFRRAISIDPKFGSAYGSLAQMLHSTLGRTDESLELYAKAVELEDRDPATLVNYGVALQSHGRSEEARVQYESAVRLQEELPEAHFNLGSLLHRNFRDPAKAIEHFNRAIELRETFHEAHHGLASAAQDLARMEVALKAAQRAVQLQPESYFYLNTLGNVLADIGDPASVERSIKAYKRAIQINSTFETAYSNLGRAYKIAERMDEAIQIGEISVKMSPDSPHAHTHLADAYKDSNKILEAVVHYRRATELDPSYEPAFCYLVYALQFACDWTDRKQNFDKLASVLNGQLSQSLPVHQCVHPFMALAYPIAAELQLKISQKFAEKVITTALEAVPNPRSRSVLEYARTFTKSRRLSVGYVSPDFGDHPVGKDMAHLFSMHDASKFEIFCFALNKDDNTEWRRHAAYGCEHFIDISALTIKESYEEINRHGLHFMIDLCGYTKGARSEVYALQPAAIQVMYKGFMFSSGAPHMQYFVTDKITSPPHLHHHYTENMVYMPDSFFVSDYPQAFPELLRDTPVPVRSDYGLPEGKFLFSNFNQLYKIDPRIFKVWMNILRRVPDSVLWLQESPPAAVPALMREVEAAGIPAHRVVFTPIYEWKKHMWIKSLSDLFLDTPLYNAHGSGTDIIWAGVPLLTLPQTKMASRVAASLNTALGATELIVHSLQEYEDRAVYLATHPEELAALRQKVKDARITSSLFQTERWVRLFERTLALMWDSYLGHNGKRMHLILAKPQSSGYTNHNDDHGDEL